MSYLFVSASQLLATDMIADPADPRHTTAAAVAPDSGLELQPLDKSAAPVITQEPPLQAVPESPAAVAAVAPDPDQAPPPLASATVPDSDEAAEQAAAQLITDADAMTATGAALSKDSSPAEESTPPAAAATTSLPPAPISPASSTGSLKDSNDGQSAPASPQPAKNSWTFRGALAAMNPIRYLRPSTSPTPETTAELPKDPLAPLKNVGVLKAYAVRMKTSLTQADMNNFPDLAIAEILPVLKGIKSRAEFLSTALDIRLGTFSAGTYNGCCVILDLVWGPKVSGKWEQGSERTAVALTDLVVNDEQTPPSKWLTDRYNSTDTKFKKMGIPRKNEFGHTYACYGLEVGDQAFVMQVLRMQHLHFIDLLASYHQENGNIKHLQEICRQISVMPASVPAASISPVQPQS
jgi:hypothetical protein